MLNVQETWLDEAFQVPKEHEQKVRVLHSKPKDSKGQGVLTMTRFKKVNLQPTLELLWTLLLQLSEYWLMISIIHLPESRKVQDLIPPNPEREKPPKPLISLPESH